MYHSKGVVRRKEQLRFRRSYNQSVVKLSCKVNEEIGDTEKRKKIVKRKLVIEGVLLLSNARDLKLNSIKFNGGVA